jgi:signal transduction histidine kinase
LAQTHSLLTFKRTPTALQQWLGEQIEPLCEAVSERMPNMLVGPPELAELLRTIATHLDVAPENQLAKIQFWAITEVGYDAPFAGDWRTALRVLKHELVNRLEQHFPAGEALRYWRELDELFTYALIEVTQLSSDIDHAVMLDHVVSLRQQTEKFEQTKTNFVVVAAHELRTPLTILEGYAKMLAAETQAEVTLKVYVDGLISGLGRMKELITDLIDVSLLDLRTMELEYNQFYLEKIILMVADSVSGYFAERNVELIIKPLPIQQRIYGDAERLAKAFTKVIMNGLKYTPNGGTVTINSVMQGVAETAVDYIDVQITDTGIGIDPEDLETIFRKFSSTSDVKLHSSGKTKFKGDGPGLGLPIAKGIVEAHGGRIWVESPGCDEVRCPGSTFHIELPILLEKPNQ